MILLPEKKLIAEIPSKSQQVATHPKQNIQIIETTDPNRHKKMRTVVLVHSEMDMNEREGEVISKATSTENGFKKKCSCECCRKLDLNELLVRLGELLEERR